MKLFKRFILLLFVLASVALGIAWAYMDEIIQNGITKYAPAITQVDVKVRNVRLFPLNGHGAIEGLVVGNPRGYRSAEAIRIDSAALNIVARSLFEDKVIVESLVIIAPEVTLEGGLKSNNLTAILANIQQSISSSPSPAEKPKGQGKKLQVDKLNITGIKAKLAFSMLGGKGITVTVPDILLHHLGTGPEGITPAELSQQIMSALSSGTLNAAKNQVRDLGKVLGNAGGKVLGGAVEVGSGSLNVVKKGFNGVGDLLKK